MIVENIGSYGNTYSHQVLAYAQTISNHFIDALEQNDCSLKILVGFYFEMDETINNIEDLRLALEPVTPSVVPNRTPPIAYPGFGYEHTPPSDALSTPAGVDATVKAMKERCFHCKIGLPKLSFDKDFRFLYNRLSLQLDVFKSVFKIDKPNLGNLCHVSFAFRRACLPDILKLIAMLLMAYSAILALNKLPRISIGVFVRAIIGKLMAEVVANVKLSIDMSQTGLPCILSAIDEISRAIPTKQEIWDLEMSDEVRNEIFPREPYKTLTGKTKQPFVPQSEFIQQQRERLRKKEITQAEYDSELEAYNKANAPLRHYASKVRDRVESNEAKAVGALSEGFDRVSNVVQKAQDDINAYISALLGVIDYFECEGTRTGPDFTELLEYMNNLQTVINFVSAVLGKWLTKFLSPVLCMDTVATKDIQRILSQDPNRVIELSNSDIADIISEFTGNQAKLDKDGVSVLLYDRPVKRLLPKLELVGCNIKEFADAHKIDRLIDKVAKDGYKEPKQDPYRFHNQPNNWKPFAPFVVPKDPTLPIRVPITHTPIRVVVPKNVYPAFEQIRTGELLNRIRERVKPNGKLPFPIPPRYVDDRIPSIPTPIKPILPRDVDEKDVGGNAVNPSDTNEDKPLIPDSDREKPIHRIDLGSGVTAEDLPDFVNELDKIIDFIYSPPDSALDRRTPSNLDDLLDSNNVLSPDRAKSKALLPPQTECLDFDQVLNVINTLNL